MSEELRVRLLGSPAAFVRNEPVSGFVSVKAQALLYYLAATGEIHRRDTLASLLWSDVPDSTATCFFRCYRLGYITTQGETRLHDGQYHFGIGRCG